jgi:hypothetical protein
LYFGQPCTLVPVVPSLKGYGQLQIAGDAMRPDQAGQIGEPPSETPQVISIEGTIAALLAILLAVVDLNWMVRIALVVCGIGLIAYLAWRLPGSKLARAACVIVASAFLIALSWGPIRIDLARAPHRLPTLSKCGWLAFLGILGSDESPYS